MRIGLVSPYDLDAPGGVQGQVLGLAHHLADRDHEVVVVGPGAAADRRVGRVVAVPANGSVAPLGIGRIRPALADRDVVHVHEPLQPLGWAALGVQRPTVATFHADPPGWVASLTAAAAPIVRRRLRHTILTAVSDVAAARWEAIGLRARRIPNGVDVAGVAPDRPEPGRVVFVGRDEPRKGLDVLVEAWGIVRRTHGNAELVVVGSDRDAGPGSRSLGRVADPVKWTVLAGSAVACVPATHGESFGLVLVEAMAAGCAVVASDIPAFRAVAGEAAAYVPVGDAPALAAAITRLLDDEVIRTSLADQARRRARSYDWSAVTAAYERAYADVVG